MQLLSEIRRLAPDADENVYGGLKMANVLYSVGSDTNVFCGIQPANDRCKLYLHHVRPGDVPDLKIEGSGKHARHVKVATNSDAHAEGSGNSWNSRTEVLCRNEP